MGLKMLERPASLMRVRFLIPDLCLETTAGFRLL